MQRGPANATIGIIFEGARLSAMPGATVAATLIANGVVAQSESKSGEATGFYCGIGVCHDCVVSIDGRYGQRSCLTKVRDGMRVARQSPYPVPAAGLARDLAAVRATDPVPRVVDVLVVGAGQAGLAAALAAAKADAGVLVVDERPAPDPVAGVTIEGETLVWGGARRPDGGLEITTFAQGSVGILHPRRLIIATGAYDRPVVVPGWTLPGVMTAGATQTLLRSNGLSPGQRVVIAGTGPFNLQLAVELLPLARRITLVEAASAPTRPHVDPRRASLAIHWRHRLIAIEGEGRASRAVIAPVDEAGAVDRGRAFAIEADAVVTGDGFWPETELARLLGCEANPSQTDIVVVGDAGAVCGADIGLCLAEPSTIVCRCESVTLGTLQGTIERHDARDLGSLKRLTRAGMGRCQGRYCAPRLGELLGEPVGSGFAPQMPLRPVPLAALAAEKPEWSGHRRSLLPAQPAASTAEPLTVTKAATVIIGAGIVGLSTALFLAREGDEVVVLDSRTPNAGASGGNAGSLHAQLLSFDHATGSNGSPAAKTLPLQSDSIALWQSLAAELGMDMEIEVSGGIMVAETERDLGFLHAKTAVERAQGVDCRVIGPAEVQRLEPHLDGRFLGAAYCPEEGKINPLIATESIREAACAAGAVILAGAAVQAVTQTGGRFTIETARGAILAHRVINAAGAFASEIGAMLGVSVPVFGAPLQMVVTEPAAPLLCGLVAHADRHLTLKQAANGSIIIGGGWTAGLDPVNGTLRPFRASLEGNLWVAQHVLPALRKLHVVRSWAAMNIDIDGAPILGEDPRMDGLFHAVTSNGYTLGPIMGRMTADIICRGRTDRDISAFSVTRFGRHA
jgi:glycine/D-amino acid oxidase-like deaminating enzyme